MHSEMKRRDLRRSRRGFRIRKGVRGSGEKPRLTVFKSNVHLFAQLIDDDASRTLASAGTMMKEFRKAGLAKKNKEAAKQLGRALAEKAHAQKVRAAVFDRGHRKYHGLLAALAEGAREAGLKI